MVLAANAPAKAFCLLNCEPTEDQAKKVFENLVKAKFDPDAKLVDFKVDRFWQLDVEGAGHKGVEFYFTAKVEFPKGAHLECKPTEAADGAKTVAPGCSPSTYYSTTVQNQMIKDKQYIEPGKVVDFKDETRFDRDLGRLERPGRQDLLIGVALQCGGPASPRIRHLFWRIMSDGALRAEPDPRFIALRRSSGR